MTDVCTFGVDCPRGWGLWGLRGPLAAGSINGKSLEVRERVVDELVAAAGGRKIMGGIVEVPFGESQAHNPRTLATYARGVGWIECELTRRGLLYADDEAGAWRRRIHMRGNLSRVQVKSAAVGLALKMKAECRAGEAVALHGPEGGILEDAAEGLCISAAAWVMLAGWTGALECWKNKNSFWTGSPSTG